MSAMYNITNEDPTSPAATQLIEELSKTLALITGDSGKSSFDPNDVRGSRACFVVARTSTGIPVGCGAFRPLEESTAEIKRMYAALGTSGVGSIILSHLEREAKALGYSQLWLETRIINQRAVSFYEKHGYSRIPNFGKYIGKPEAVCFAKTLLI